MGPGMTSTVDSPITCVENGPGGGGLPKMEIIIPPIEFGVLFGLGLWFGLGLGSGVVFALASPAGVACDVGVDVEVCSSFGSTYIVCTLVKPPPAGIATVDGNGSFVDDVGTWMHLSKMRDGPPGTQPFNPGYCALYAGFWIK